MGRQNQREIQAADRRRSKALTRLTTWPMTTFLISLPAHGRQHRESLSSACLHHGLTSVNERASWHTHSKTVMPQKRACHKSRSRRSSWFSATTKSSIFFKLVYLCLWERESININNNISSMWNNLWKKICYCFILFFFFQIKSSWRLSWGSIQLLHNFYNFLKLHQVENLNVFQLSIWIFFLN